jgi:hypothetical protein
MWLPFTFLLYAGGGSKSPFPPDVERALEWKPFGEKAEASNQAMSKTAALMLSASGV